MRPSPARPVLVVPLLLAVVLCAACVRRAGPAVATGSAPPGASPTGGPAAPAGGAVAAPDGDAADTSGTIVLRSARMFTATSERTERPGVVVVRAGRIVGVGAAAIPPGARVIDLGDATLLPGLIDVHTHLTTELGDDWQKDELDWLKRTVAETTAIATTYARRTLRAGFTTVRDLGAGDYMDVGLRNAIRSGHVEGPRMLVSTHAVGALGGHCDPTGGYRPGLLHGREPGIEDGIGAGPDELRAAVRHAIKHGADVIKVCATGGVLSLADAVDSAQLTQAELDAIVDEARALGRRVAAHAHGAEGAKRAVRAGVVSIEHGSFMDDEGFRLMKARNAVFVWTPTPCLTERLARPGVPPEIREKDRLAVASEYAAFRRALALGVRIAYGTDAGVCPHGENAGNLALMVAEGMRPGAALLTATANAAELLGVAEALGTLAPGKLADVIAVRGDPLRDMRVMGSVQFVMKGGQIVRHDGARP